MTRARATRGAFSPPSDDNAPRVRLGNLPTVPPRRISMKAVVIIVVVAAAAGLAGCASPALDARSGPASVSPTAAAGTSGGPAPTASPICAEGRGFDVALPSGPLIGVADPIEAARKLVRDGNTPGFGTPTSAWRIARVGGNVDLTDGRTTLHAVEVGQHTWLIISGETCAD